MDVLIVGAGVAGSACALALARRGHRVRIVERRATGQALGAGVVLWPNATFVMDQLGLLAELRAVGRTPPAMRRFDARGSSLGGWDLAQFDAQLGWPSIAVLRADLQAILARALAAEGIAIEERHEAIRIADDGDGARVVFADRSSQAADLILGADGRMASVARRFVAPDRAPTFQRFVNWVGTAIVAADVLGDGAVQDYWGVGHRFGIVPVAADRAYWAAARAMPSPPEGPAETREELLAMFASWPPAIAQVILGTDPQVIRRIAIYDLDPLPAWHRGNVLLVGDAAHAALPTSGQGACQALEDAWHLAELVHDAADLARTLPAFTALRAGKVRGMMMAGRQFAHSLFHLDAEACRERDAAARRADDARTIAGIAQAWRAGLPM